MKGFVFLDVGGTQIRSAAFSGDGKQLGAALSVPSRAKEDRNAILANFLAVIADRKKLLDAAGLPLNTVGFAFPGPFDYPKGICLIRGLDKYESLYGISLPEALLGFPGQRTVTPETGIFFRHDVASFALGEACRSLSAETERVLCLCIGTGAGSAFLEQGKLLEQDPRIPDRGWIHPFPLRGKTVDDWVSVRGLEKLASAARFSPGTTGKELSVLAAEGNPFALEVWHQFGLLTAEAVGPFVRSFQPQLLLLGGRISGALEWFGPALRDSLPGLALCAVPDTTESIFRGLLAAAREKQTA